MHGNDQNLAARSISQRLKKTALWGGILALFGLIFGGGYLAVQALPAFYAAPQAIPRQIVWDKLPSPLIVDSAVDTWSSAEHVTDALWTNNLVWLATNGGVVVHNVQSGEQVKFLPEHGLPSAEISTVTNDVIGRIWVGTGDSGVAVYDGGAWTTFGRDSGLPSGRIREIFAAKDGVIWAATASGLARYDGSEWSTVRFSLLDLTPIDATGVTGIDQSVWVSSREGVYRFNGQRWDYFGINEGLINDDVSSITITPDRAVWIGTPSGVGRFDGTKWGRYTVRDGLPDMPVQSIVAAPDNTVSIAFGNDDEPDLFETIRFDGLAIVPLYSGAVSNLVQQGSQLWVATAQGLVRPNSGAVLETITAGSDFKHTRLTDLIGLKNGVAIAGDAGISTLRLSNEPKPSDEVWNTVELTLEQVNGLSQADDGRLALVGQHAAEGVLLIDEAGTIETAACETAGMQVGHLYAMTETENGDLWFLGTENIGRLSLSQSAENATGPVGQWRYFPEGLPIEYGPRKIVADKNGDIWIGLNEGLFMLDEAADRWNLVLGETIQRMTSSPAGGLWLVADDALLHFVDGAFVPAPLPKVADISRGFVANEAGLWVSSANGIAHLPIDSAGEWIVYTTTDGLPTDDVTTLTVDVHGTVWAGYGDARFGVSYFKDGVWGIVHNIKDPSAPNGGHFTDNGMRRDEVVALGITADGSAWYGSFLGKIGQISPNENLYEPDDYRLYFANMTAVHAAADGTIWFAGWEGRLARLLPESVTLEPDRWLIYERDLASAKAQAVVVEDGQIWLGTDAGVAVIDDDECRLVAHRERLNVVAGIANPNDDSIWWATANHGALQLDTATEKLDWPILHLRGRKFSDMTQAADDAFVFVSDTSLIRVDGLERQILSLENLGEIFAVTTGIDLRPWVATDRGVATLRGEDWQYLTTDDGLASNRAIDILIEADGTLWVLSETAVSRIRR
ncbi:MAG: hypothetical protein AB8G95_18760 [Anaerolineae bacterium]